MMRRFLPAPGLDLNPEAGELETRLYLDRAHTEFDSDEAGRIAAAAEFGALETSAGRPIELYIPEHYEPAYPYPLVVWLHGRGGSERELCGVMSRVSERNHMGLALRGSRLVCRGKAVGFGWPDSADEIDELAFELHDTVRRLRRAYHVHSERVHLAGFDDGATCALRLFLSRPEWFAGAIALGASFSGSPVSLARFRDLTGKRVLIGGGARSASAPVSEMVRTGRLLHSAGLEVTTRTYDAGHELTAEMLAHLNRWVIEGMCAAV